MHLTESVEATTTFEVLDGQLDRADGIHNFGGFIGRLSAQCLRCHHWWHPRRAMMITDVVEEVAP